MSEEHEDAVSDWLVNFQHDLYEGWSEGTDEDTKTLVAGNINRAIYKFYREFCQDPARPWEDKAMAAQTIAGYEKRTAELEDMVRRLVGFLPSDEWIEDAERQRMQRMAKVMYVEPVKAIKAEAAQLLGEDE